MPDEKKPQGATTKPQGFREGFQPLGEARDLLTPDIMQAIMAANDPGEEKQIAADAGLAPLMNLAQGAETPAQGMRNPQNQAKGTGGQYQPPTGQQGPTTPMEAEGSPIDALGPLAQKEMMGIAENVMKIQDPNSKHQGTMADSYENKKSAIYDKKFEENEANYWQLAGGALLGGLAAAIPGLAPLSTLGFLVAQDGQKGIDAWHENAQLKLNAHLENGGQQRPEKEFEAMWKSMADEYAGAEDSSALPEIYKQKFVAMSPEAQEMYASQSEYPTTDPTDWIEKKVSRKNALDVLGGTEVYHGAALTEAQTVVEGLLESGDLPNTKAQIDSGGITDTKELQAALVADARESPDSIKQTMLGDIDKIMPILVKELAEKKQARAGSFLNWGGNLGAQMSIDESEVKKFPFLKDLEGKQGPVGDLEEEAGELFKDEGLKWEPSDKPGQYQLHVTKIDKREGAVSGTVKRRIPVFKHLITVDGKGWKGGATLGMRFDKHEDDETKQLVWDAYKAGDPMGELTPEGEKLLKEWAEITD